MMTKSIEHIKVRIVCPACKKHIGELWKARLDSVIGIKVAYICIECNKLIGLNNENENLDFNPSTILR